MTLRRVILLCWLGAFVMTALIVVIYAASDALLGRAWGEPVATGISLGLLVALSLVVAEKAMKP